MAARDRHEDDSGRGARRHRVSRSGGQGHRPPQQAQGISASGRWRRHRRGQRAARLRARSAQLRHRRADPARSRAPLHPSHHEQSAQDRGARGVWAPRRGARGHRPAGEHRERRVPRRQARQARPSARVLIDMAEFNGTPNGEGRRYAVIASRFNHQITSKLADGAMDALVRHGASSHDVDLVWVPGAWELPYAARRLAATERYNSLVVVGAVIRGETPHFDFVANAASRGLADASTEYEIPIDRKSTRLNSSHTVISYAVFCLKKKKKKYIMQRHNVKHISHSMMSC